MDALSYIKVSDANFRGRDVISTRDFNHEEIDYLFEVTRDVKRNPSKYHNSLEGKWLGLLFFEPSTRTRGSFYKAAVELGCQVLPGAEPDKSSVVKGETAYDTLKMVTGYGVDCVVVRHPKMGTAKHLADTTTVPVINAGDGAREHPTQGMLDLFTMQEELDDVDSLTIGMLGDLKYSRTVSSLSYILGRYYHEEIAMQKRNHGIVGEERPPIKVIYIAPKFLQIRPEVELDMKRHQIPFEKVDVDKLSDCLPRLDVLYVTRLQSERFSSLDEFEKVKGSYTITPEILESADRNLKVFHPLPRVDELSPRIDGSAYQKYFVQAKNGVPLRIALLYLIMGGRIPLKNKLKDLVRL